MPSATPRACRQQNGMVWSGAAASRWICSCGDGQGSRCGLVWSGVGASCWICSLEMAEAVCLRCAGLMAETTSEQSAAALPERDAEAVAPAALPVLAEIEEFFCGSAVRQPLGWHGKETQRPLELGLNGKEMQRPVEQHETS